MRSVSVILVFSLLSLWLAAQAWAHAFPDHAEPRVGSTVKTPPAAVRIWFDGNLEPLFSAIEVYDQDGKRVDKQDGHVSGAEPALLEVNLSILSAGTYRVAWSIVSVDGHPTEGNFSFTFDPGSNQ